MHIAVDFDDTLTQLRPMGQHGIQPPRPGAAAWLHGLTSLGFKVTIFTARTDFAPVQAWVNQHGLGPYISGITNLKDPSFDVIVDDRAFAFVGEWPSPADITLQRRARLRAMAGAQRGV